MVYDSNWMKFSESCTFAVLFAKSYQINKWSKVLQIFKRTYISFILKLLLLCKKWGDGWNINHTIFFLTKERRNASNSCWGNFLHHLSYLLSIWKSNPWDDGRAISNTRAIQKSIGPRRSDASSPLLKLSRKLARHHLLCLHMFVTPSIRNVEFIFPRGLIAEIHWRSTIRRTNKYQRLFNVHMGKQFMLPGKQNTVSFFEDVSQDFGRTHPARYKLHSKVI